ncbi:hypothetical protein AGR2A_Lc30151 [Agrobacterium genomosp. 2 str. CFBP 5494]|uniref:Uncharacterized protein n=1 Tax=Agrobacterium genomosp. 2 str. CFBP 5494 TaxID=1183436 RepID=A0A9W5B4R4_9HYPH|nr:hypothetical protein AGR2A_Lc30151 [Agrobacterium genomosp. 2 str. CFBP 5494]
MGGGVGSPALRKGCGRRYIRFDERNIPFPCAFDRHKVAAQICAERMASVTKDDTGQLPASRGPGLSDFPTCTEPRQQSRRMRRIRWERRLAVRHPQ